MALIEAPNLFPLPPESLSTVETSLREDPSGLRLVKDEIHAMRKLGMNPDFLLMFTKFVLLHPNGSGMELGLAIGHGAFRRAATLRSTFLPRIKKEFFDKFSDSAEVPFLTPREPKLVSLLHRANMESFELLEPAFSLRVQEVLDIKDFSTREQDPAYAGLILTYNTLRDALSNPANLVDPFEKPLYRKNQI